MDEISRNIRENIIRISNYSGHGHIPTCFSVVEMIRSVYETMQHKPQDHFWPKRDIFILSKGHAALAHYCVLSQQGYFPIEEVYNFGSHLSKFGCHADRNKVNGVEWSTGSLGHGISVAVGFALDIKLKQEERRVFVLIGDGESNEGTVWESLQVATHLRLDNLTVMLDWNQSQKRCMQLTKAAEKFTAMGCRTIEVDGHDMEQLSRELAIPVADGRPFGLICHTGKGYGCKTLMNDIFAWHRRSPTSEELQMLLGELRNA